MKQKLGGVPVPSRPNHIMPSCWVAVTQWQYRVSEANAISSHFCIFLLGRAQQTHRSRWYHLDWNLPLRVFAQKTGWMCQHLSIDPRLSNHCINFGLRRGRDLSTSKVQPPLAKRPLRALPSKFLTRRRINEPISALPWAIWVGSCLEG